MLRGTFKKIGLVLFCFHQMFGVVAPTTQPFPITTDVATTPEDNPPTTLQPGTEIVFSVFFIIICVQICC